MLQVLAILRELPERNVEPAVADHFAASFRALAGVRQRSRAAAGAVLGYPHVNAWSTHTLRRLRTGVGDPRTLADDLGHLGAITAAVALAAGEGFDLTLRVRLDGTVMIPTFGLARLGVPPGWYQARAEPAGPGFRVDLGTTVVEVPVRSATTGPHWWPARRLDSELDGHRIAVRLDDVDPYRDCNHIGAARRVPDAEMGGWQAGLDQAWAILVRRHRPRAAALSAGVAALVPLEPVDGVDGRSASTSDACGTVALTKPADGRTLAVTLVHEFQHSKLSALLDLVRLYRDGGDGACYAPWRQDPRPVTGLLQGAYAYLGLVDYWQDQRLAEVGAHSRVAHFEFTRWRHAVRRVLQTVAASGLLTAAGERFLGGMRQRLAELRAHPAPIESERLARDALADHWVRWRLHNLQPDEEHLAACAAAWLAGAPCPPGRPGPATVRTDPRRWAAANARLELTYRRLRDPGRFEALCTDQAWLTVGVPGARPADAAYALADYPTAAGLYLGVLADAPDDTSDRADAWAGLVLAHRRLRRSTRRFLVAYPESLHALHRRIAAAAGQPPDAEALAGWLDGVPHPGVSRQPIAAI
ncbi:MAG TPA: HEXXH motif domain-containing protein [Mycobacteriales bacterium]|nr:HEXXH motif domain-containing protein [Mycobacteriales bacterium]